MADCGAMSAPPTTAPLPAAAAAVAGRAAPGDDEHAHDARLMAAYAAGDARAFEELYRRHHQALYRFVRRLLGSSGAAQVDEVFQDAWLRVVQSRQSWRADGGASFRTWLYTLAHRRVIDLWRRSGREVSLQRDEDEDAPPFEPAEAPWSQWPMPAEAAGSEERLFWRHAGERLLHCLDQLPPAQRAVFLLHHEDGFAVDEAARLLELGFETAKSRLRYAMVKLRTCMGAYLPPAHGRVGELR